MKFRATLLISICGLMAVGGFAQDGVSTAGTARTKMLGRLGILPKASDVVVEDFVNYHRHEIGRPKAGESVGLDLRWGSSFVAPGGDAILQVGLSTALATDRKNLRPLNLSLVIDKSGSMSAADKMSRVKVALQKLVTQLRPSDILSIVVFDSEASVLIPSQPVSDGENIGAAISQIQPGSSTNIHAGLMLGYSQALEHYRKGWTNRVVLLTDGIANVGVTKPETIARESREFNDRGIDLSTIGVGLDLNKDLLATLAKSGRGLFHFVADSEDIEKVFVKEAQSLLSPVANDPRLVVEFGSGLELQQVYGFSPKTKENSVSIDLDRMNSGMTEVVLMRFRSTGRTPSPDSMKVTARLTFNDIDRNRQVTISQMSSIKHSEPKSGGKLEDSSVAKNYTIAQLAQAIRDMATDCERSQYVLAEKKLSGTIERAKVEFPNSEDEDVKRVLELAQQYRAILREEIQMRGLNREIDGEIAGNLIPNSDFAEGNHGFISPGYTYVDPAENCLWPAGYTVAPSFNRPQLHRLIAAKEFAAPQRATGKEQVFFANAGGTDQRVVISTQVKCKANTRYKISFQVISLTPGAEWIPTFEIRANSDRSEPQAASDVRYVPVAFEWNSGSSPAATISIVRMPIPHGGGLIGIANFRMVEVH